MLYCWSLCTLKTNFGLKYSKPVITVSGCPHEYVLCNVEMGLASLPCDPDWDMTAYSTGRCSLYAVGQLGQTFCGFTSKQEHILQLCSGPASVRLSCVLTEKPLSYHPASKYLNGSPAKTTLPQTAFQTIPQCDCGCRGYNGPSCDLMQSSLRNQALRWDDHLDPDDYSMRQSTNNTVS